MSSHPSPPKSAIQPLTLFVKRDGGPRRSSLTCRYKCGDACAHEAPNTSGNEYFGDIVRSALSRRGMLKGGAAVVAAFGTGGLLAACGDDEPTGTAAGGTLVDGVPVGTNFTPVVPNSEDAFVTAAGYEHQVVIRWGDPLFADAPKFDPARQTPESQAKQFGFNNDFAALLPIDGAPDTYLMVVNHEYTTEPQMFPGYDPANPSEVHYRTALAAHGLSVVQVRGEAGSGRLTPEFGQYNRRITGTTEFVVTGPAAGSPLLKTAADPTGTKVLGTFNNCSGGRTPWGTVLSGEENINQYFANAGQTPEPAKSRLARYGFSDASERKWERFDPRFDLTKEPNEANRFGWVVEVDPWDPSAKPIKHTALGRFKHEAATIHVTGDGTVVAYLGDDERFDYMYKFVSSRKMQSGGTAADRRTNTAILDAGTLYVAKFTGDHPDRIDGSGKPPSDQGFTGKGSWIPLLVTGEDGKAESKVEGFTAEEVAVFTRLAADKAGATKMDRPEDFEANPKSGKVYVALTNNEKRGTDGKAAADEANPRNANKFGQVLELDDDHAGTTFTWTVLLLCGDPKTADTYFAGFDKANISPIAAPDNLAFDDHGNLWISTDSSRAMEANDGLFSVVLDGPNRGETKQFLTVPFGAETCGPIVTGKRVTVCVQHPGERDGATADKPASHWPDGGSSLPRPSVVAVWNGKGGNIGA
ncbi:PhoX family phosphatase [Nocardia sp. BMG51109]|uniref:PhoX family protein n=1 Tax=Nocardia sp. BMG51109 TaxID=1056816 RepID=UPI0004B469C7|nr:PhoX family phosphatase [Nocardia sp. BMG51109]